MASTNAATLRSVNGSWFCPSCFVSCSTKGNLKRHIAKVHANDNSLVESNVESAPKVMFLDRSSFDTTCVEDDTDDELLTEELDFDLEEEKQSTESPEQGARNPSDSLPLTDIQTLYTRLSEDFRAKTEKSEQTTSHQEIAYCDSTSETDSKDNMSDDSIIWSSDEEIVDEDGDDDKKDRPVFEGSNVTYEEHLMAIAGVASRHNLNQAQLTDMIELIKLHSPNGDVCVRSPKALYREVTGDLEIKYHDVCEDCNGLFPEDADVYRCTTSGCSGNYLTVVNVDAIQEKVFYLSGNKYNICVCRAPNFVERE